MTVVSSVNTSLRCSDRVPGTTAGTAVLNLTLATSCRRCAVHTAIVFRLVRLRSGSAYRSIAPLVRQPKLKSYSDDLRWSDEREKPRATVTQNRSKRMTQCCPGGDCLQLFEPSCAQAEAIQRNKTRRISKTTRHACEIGNILAFRNQTGGTAGRDTLN